MDKTHANQEWTESTFILNAKIVKMGVNNYLAPQIINGCKETAIDPLKCVKTYVSHYGNESTFGKFCKDYACWGRRFVKYNSEKEAFDDWLWRYNTFWYTHTGGSFFYGGNGWLGKSGFCHSEESSGSKTGCPNGAKTFNYFYNKI